MKKKKKNLQLEALTNPKMEQQVQKLVLGEIVDYKNIPEFGLIIKRFEDAYLSNLLSMKKENLLDDQQQQQWIDMVNNFAKSLSKIIAIGAMSSATNKQRNPVDGVNLFKQMVLPQLMGLLNNFKQTKLDVSKFENIFNDETITPIMNFIYSKNADELKELVIQSPLSPDSKKKTLDRIEKYKTNLPQTNQRMYSPTKPTVGPGGAKTVVDVSPELSNIIATNFKSYMSKIQQKFGVGGLKALKQAIDTQINKPS